MDSQTFYVPVQWTTKTRSTGGVNPWSGHCWHCLSMFWDDVNQCVLRHCNMAAGERWCLSDSSCGVNGILSTYYLVTVKSCLCFTSGVKHAFMELSPDLIRVRPSSGESLMMMSQSLDLLLLVPDEWDFGAELNYILFKYARVLLSRDRSGWVYLHL